VAAAKIKQRFAVAHFRGLHLAYENRMVAAGVRMDYPAFDVSQCSIYQRRSRFSFPVADPFEPVCIPRCKPARNRFLVLSQDVNRKEGASCRSAYTEARPSIQMSTSGG